MTRTTLLPFLYQTRTLQRLPQPVFAAWRRHLHGPQNRAAGGVHFKKESKSPTGDPIPFELPPDLQDLMPKDADGVSESESSGRSTITPTEQSTFDLIFQEIATRYASSLPPRSSFMDQEASTNTSPPTFSSLEDAGESHSAQTPQANLGRTTTGPDPARGKGVINLIIQDAADSSARRKNFTYPFDPLSALSTVNAPADRVRAFLRFPPSLRAAARLAFEGPISCQNLSEHARADREGEADNLTSVSDKRLVDERGSDNVSPPRSQAGHFLTHVTESELLRGAERARVEALMRKATNDFELWDVLEREVFAMVDRLGIRDAKAKGAESNGRANSNRNQRHSPKKCSLSTAEQDAGAPGTRDSDSVVAGPVVPEPLSMHVFGPLYPSFLLLALRMLDTSFAAPSPLALALLPRIKELGLASYLLGATTPLYTEIAAALWRRSGAVTDILALFEEMHHAGLYFSVESLRLADTIYDTISKSRQGEQGRFLQGLAVILDIDDNIFARLRHWRRLIYRSMSTRVDELGY